jgi:hypothetical protein
MKKAIIGFAVAVCLLIAGAKIYNFYQSTQPPFEVGECFSISDPRVGEVKFEVVENNLKDSTTVAIGSVEVLPGVQLQVPVKATFEEIRESNPKAVSCE